MTTKESKKLRCAITGSGTLPIRCAELLIERDVEICAIISSDAGVKNFAKSLDLPLFGPDQDIAECLKDPFEYLFSIVNPHILSSEVLNLPTKLAINYHDSPLPGYAGTHATSWALINGEETHGISWHVITDVVDAGDLLKQTEFKVSENDTALTLNTKCYEAAIVAFGEMVDELIAGNAKAQSQDLSHRTFYPRYKRPKSGGIISWNSPAKEISRLVRALKFGNHPNPLGVARFVVENQAFFISDVEISESGNHEAPGTIKQIGEDSITVSTSDDDLIVREVCSLSGSVIPVSEFARKYDLRVGKRFLDLTDEDQQQAEDNIRMVCKSEPYWVNKLERFEPAVAPFAETITANDSPDFESITVKIEDDIYQKLSIKGSSENCGEVVTAFGAFLARLNSTESFNVGFWKTSELVQFGKTGNLYAMQVPLSFSIDSSRRFSEVCRDVIVEIAEVANHKAFARDIIARYPTLRKAYISGERFKSPVAIALVDGLGDFEPVEGNELVLVVGKDPTEYRWIYDRSRFTAENIERFTDHFAAFLVEIAENPDSPIADLPLITDHERHKLLVEWNETGADYPKDMCIHDLFEIQASKTPDAVALIHESGELTYKELNQRANQLAHHLKSLGVVAESLVGVCLDRTPEMLIGILAVLKAGGAYVPLDPAYPNDRIGYMLEDSRAVVIITTQNVSQKFDNGTVKVVYLDSDRERISKESTETPQTSVRQDNLAYVIYTSGSTGNPKGVAIEHRSAVAFLTWVHSAFTREQLKGVLGSTSICFDLSIFEMFAPLTCGGAIILVENILHLPTSSNSDRVTLINTVPSAITELVRIKGIPSGASTVNLAGEPLKTALVEKIYETPTVKKVFDLYGPSEDTTYSTFTKRDGGRANIGRPIANTHAFVLDSFLSLVPVGIPGELFLGGAGLARGYLNRPELTEEKFIKNPYGKEPSDRIYRTGDLVRYLPSGAIEYLGRIDNQVKIRGFRIELGEVESVLLSHPGVKDVVVVAREDHLGDKRLAAYIVSESAETKMEGAIRTFLMKTLPDYMIPSTFTELSELPLTPNGKIDKKALPEPSADQTPNSVHVASRDDVETRLVAIWEELLNISPIGIRDDFFEMGGHSLQAVRMFAEIEEKFGKNVPLATLFEAGTIEKLADILRQDGWESPESSIVPIQPNGSRPNFFCVHAKGGNVLFYRDLSKRLGNDQPFFGIQARRLGGRQVGHATVEEMADYYIKEMKLIQPNGPYFIGGASFGGLVVFEIARKLYERGEKVALLALFDTGTPDYPKLLPTTTAIRSRVFSVIRRVQHHKNTFLTFNSKERAEYIINKLGKFKLKYRRKLVNTYKKYVRKFYLKAKGSGSIPKNYIQIEDQIWKAGQKYSPEVYAGNMMLFRASNQPLGIYPDPTLGWDRFVGGELEIQEVPGHHGSIVAEPYVRVLADELNKRIEKAIALEDIDGGIADQHKVLEVEFTNAKSA